MAVRAASTRRFASSLWTSTLSGGFTTGAGVDLGIRAKSAVTSTTPPRTAPATQIALVLRGRDNNRLVDRGVIIIVASLSWVRGGVNRLPNADSLGLAFAGSHGRSAA